jgi:predicted O-methyltransferase YrrM
MWPMRFERAAELLDGIPNMTPSEGYSIYQHLIRTGAANVLEIGTAHAVSASYMAAALDEAGAGRVTTVDSRAATALRDPQPNEVLDRVGLSGLVDRVLVDDSSYTWWLKEKVQERSDDAGNCEPEYDFCYLDGAHNWTIDGFSVYLIEKLMRPGGWLLLDDLTWSYGDRTAFGPGQGPADLRLSEREAREPHMRAVYELVVRQHPAFTEFRIEEGNWGWAHKAPEQPRRLELTRAPVPGRTMLALTGRRVGREIKSGARRARRSMRRDSRAAD